MVVTELLHFTFNESECSIDLLGKHAKKSKSWILKYEKGYTICTIIFNPYENLILHLQNLGK